MPCIQYSPEEEKEEDIVVEPLPSKDLERPPLSSSMRTESLCGHDVHSGTTTRGRFSKEASFAGNLAVEPSDLVFRATLQQPSTLLRDTQCLASQQEQVEASPHKPHAEIKPNLEGSSLQTTLETLKVEDLGRPQMLLQTTAVVRKAKGKSAIRSSFAGAIAVEPPDIHRKSSPQARASPLDLNMDQTPQTLLEARETADILEHHSWS